MKVHLGSAVLSLSQSLSVSQPQVMLLLGVTTAVTLSLAAFSAFCAYFGWLGF